MISFFEATLKKLSIHRIGNKSQDEFYVLSDTPFIDPQNLVIEDDEMVGILLNYFLSPFEKSDEVYQFFHPNNELSLNEVYAFALRAFQNDSNFHEISIQLAKLLYDVSGHPKIKSGEFFVAYFENVQIEGELHDAIGLFKSDQKECYLRVTPDHQGFDMTFEDEAININSLKKGCLIFNTKDQEGFKVACIDQRTAKDAIYWKDEFLKVQVVNNEYNQTSNFLQVYKDFVAHKLDDEFEISKASKIDLLNKSLKYFKEKETFDLEEFVNEVISNQEAIESFKRFKTSHEDEFETTIPDNFDISDRAVKKQGNSYRGTLKLDKNFQINISGSKDLIEKGFDDDKAMNYYKVYFREEI